MLRLKALWLALIAAIALGAGLWLGQRWFYSLQPPLEIAGIYLSQPKELDEFTLVGQDGQPVTRANFKGRWSFLYFGYTYCPDACPLTLAELNKLDQLLAQQGLNRDTAYFLISVDPERDTPARLGEYVRYFNQKFQAATGSPQELEKLAKQLSVLYTIAPHQAGESYTVDHSSTLVLLDPDARLHAIFTPPHEPAKLATDFARIRQRYEENPSVKSKTSQR